MRGWCWPSFMLRTWRGGGWLTPRTASHQSNYTASPCPEILKKIHVGLACLTSYSNEPLQAPSHRCSVHKSARDVKAAVAYCQLPIKYKTIMLSFSSGSTKNCNNSTLETMIFQVCYYVRACWYDYEYIHFVLVLSPVGFLCHGCVHACYVRECATVICV
uniref:Uncharacterized protein n=1 Tax=Triticum urartu TaxID=4572 RepID=A0A8R7P6P6_TRIUA